ncbi:MAG: DUF2169 domain-containing protein [Pseudomonadota bacterium]
MQIIKPLSLSLLHRTLYQKQRYQLCVSPLLFFSLSEPGKIIPEQIAWQKVMVSLGEGEALDVCAPKFRGEVLLAGQAVPEDGSGATRIKAGFQLGNLVEKHAVIVGDQCWRLRGNKWTLSKPEPLQPTSLGWNNAYGGAGFVDNPIGTGFLDAENAKSQTEIRLPNIRAANGEYLKFDRLRDGRSPCIGFGAMDLRAPIRQQRAGTYDDDWFKNDYPGLARDHHPAIHNVAQEDQWIDGYLQGTEKFTISGMHPEKPELSGKLPGMRTRAFAQKVGSSSNELIEIDLVVDTLWLFPNEDMGVLISRGLLDVEDSDSLDVESLMIAYERMSDSSRSQPYYQKVHRLRTDPETAVAHLLNESQLVAEKTALQLQQESEEVAAEIARRDAVIQANEEAAKAEVDAALADSDLEVVQALAPKNLQAEKFDDAALGKLAEQAGKLGLAYGGDTQGSPKDPQAVKKVLGKLQEQPLEEWQAESASKVDVKSQSKQAAEFARQVQSLGDVSAANSEQVFAAAEELNKSQADAAADIAAKLEQADLDTETLNSTAQAAAVQLAQLAPAQDSSAPVPEITELLEQMDELPPAHLASDLQAQIGKLAQASQKNTDQEDPQLSQDPQELFAKMPVISPQAIERGDIDLTGIISAAKQLTDQASSDAEQRLSALPAQVDAAVKEAGGEQQPDQATKLTLADVEADLEARFEPPASNEYIDAAQAQELEECKRLARLAAPEDTTDAKQFSPEVQQNLRERVITLLQEGLPLKGLDLSGADLHGLDFSTQDLAQVMLESSNLSGCNFTAANLHQAILTAANIDQANFDGAILSASNLSSISGKQVSFKGCQFIETKIINAKLDCCDFSGATFNSLAVMESELESALFKQCKLDKVQWLNCQLANSDWRQSDMAASIFMQAELPGALFTEAELVRCIFVETPAAGARFDHTMLDCVQFAGKCTLERADFSQCTAKTVGLLGIDLSQTKLVDSIFKESNFSDCIIHDTDLTRAGFLRCVFSGARIKEVQAQHSNFMESLLRKSHWQDSDLRSGEFFNTDVSETVFEQCDLHHAKNIGPMAEVRA